jgi:hypothetical protein
VRKGAGRRIACNNQLRQLGLALRMYVDENPYADGSTRFSKFGTAFDPLNLWPSAMPTPPPTPSSFDALALSGRHR